MRGSIHANPEEGKMHLVLVLVVVHVAFEMLLVVRHLWWDESFAAVRTMAFSTSRRSDNWVKGLGEAAWTPLPFTPTRRLELWHC